MTTVAIAHPRIVSRDEWLAGAKNCSRRRMKLTRANDTLSASAAGCRWS